MDIRQWRQSGFYKSLNGYNVFVCDSGPPDQTAILLIHGFPTASWDWNEVWDALAADYRLVAFDLLGFGFSDKPNPHRYSITEQADLAEGLCLELGLQSFHVLAHDYGDTVAQELLARQNRKAVADWLSVCFLNGGLFPETHRARLIQKLLASPLGPMIGKLLGQRQFEKSFSAVFGQQTQPSQGQLDSFWQLITFNQGQHVFHNLIGYMAERRQQRQRWIDALTGSTIPIGVINGSADPVSGAHMVKRFRELIGSEYFIRELPDIGHYPQVEAPNKVVRAYRDFLSSINE